MNKRDEISDQLYSKMMSIGGQPARLNGLAQVHTVCHSARLAPRNLPARHENRNRSLSDKKLLRRRVRILWSFNYQKFDLCRHISQKCKNGHLEPESDEKEKNSWNSEKQSYGNDRKNKASYRDDHAR